MNDINFTGAMGFKVLKCKNKKAFLSRGDNWRLLSPLAKREDYVIETYWQDGYAQADCNSQHGPQTIPVYNCHCGFYAGYELPLILEWADECGVNLEKSLVLIVMAGGKTFLHQRGFRSEEMRIIGVVDLYGKANARAGTAKLLNIEIYSIQDAKQIVNTCNTQLGILPSNNQSCRKFRDIMTGEDELSYEMERLHFNINRLTTLMIKDVARQLG